MKLKSQNEYRRLKKPFIFILSIILTLSICLIEGFKTPYRADNDATPTTYGSYSTNQYYNGNTNGITGSRSEYPLTILTYSLNGTYNGRFTIYWKYWRSGTAYTDTLQAIELMIPINCYVESISDSSCTIAFKNQSEVAILLQSKAINDEIEITGISNYNMTKITDGTATQLEHLNTMIDQIYTNSGTIITRLNTIVSQTDGVESGLTNINNNVVNILNEIQDYFTDNNGVTVNIGDIILQFNEFNANLQLQLGILNDLKSALLDIDNKIDTITWLGHEQYIYKVNNTSLSGTYSDMTASYTYGNRIYIKIPQAFMNENDKIYHLHIPLYSDIINQNTQMTITVYDQWGNLYDADLYYELKNNRNIDIYLHLPTIKYSDVVIRVISNSNLISSSMSATGSYREYITRNDIEYWNILDSIKTYKYRLELIDKLNELKPINYNIKLDSIIAAINNLNMSVTNTTVNDTQVNIENYNDIMTDIENIEINFNTQFNTSSNSISQESINAPTFSAERQLLTKVTNELVMSNNKMKYIVYIILLGFVVIRILG